MEALLYPFVWGADVAADAPELVAALKRHTVALLSDPQRRNLFADGGIKLSSTSNNSWMSKIAIFQHVDPTRGGNPVSVSHDLVELFLHVFAVLRLLQ